MREALPGVSLAIVLAATLAEASAPERAFARLELHSAEATASCIEKRELEVAVERRLRRKVFREPAGLVFDVRLARSEQGWTAELVLFDAQGRELGRRALDTKARDCSALDASLALVVALLVDSPPEPPPPVETAPAGPPVTPPVPPTPPPTRIELPKDTHAPREPWHFVPTRLVLRGVRPASGLCFRAARGRYLSPALLSRVSRERRGAPPARGNDGIGRIRRALLAPRRGLRALPARAPELVVAALGLRRSERRTAERERLRFRRESGGAGARSRGYRRRFELSSPSPDPSEWSSGSGQGFRSAGTPIRPQRPKASG